MSDLTEDEVDELLGAYALGALSEPDLGRVREHLAACSRHAGEAAGLVRAAAALALAVEDREPSPQLRERILTAAASGEMGQEAHSRATQPGLVRPAAGTRAGGWRRRPRVLAFAAAAVLLLLAGIGIGRTTAPQPTAAQIASWTFHGNAAAPSAVAHLVYFTRDHRAVIEVTGLQPLPSGRVYEMWLFKGASPQDAGVAEAPDGSLVAQLGDLTGYSQIAVTVEPGEQARPTSAPILAGSL